MRNAIARFGIDDDGTVFDYMTSKNHMPTGVLLSADGGAWDLATLKGLIESGKPIEAAFLGYGDITVTALGNTAPADGAPTSDEVVARETFVATPITGPIGESEVQVNKVEEANKAFLAAAAGVEVRLDSEGVAEVVPVDKVDQANQDFLDSVFGAPQTEPPVNIQVEPGKSDGSGTLKIEPVVPREASTATAGVKVTEQPDAPADPATGEMPQA